MSTILEWLAPDRTEKSWRLVKTDGSSVASIAPRNERGLYRYMVEACALDGDKVQITWGLCRSIPHARRETLKHIRRHTEVQLVGASVGLKKAPSTATKKPGKPKPGNRETWLVAVADRMAPRFKELGFPLPKIRMAVGFTSKGIRAKRIGECWTGDASGDKTHEIFIVPTIDDSLRIADILAHELVHAAVGITEGHGKLFGKVARSIGLEGKLTHTTGGSEFVKWAAPILKAVGPIPHSRLSGGLSTSPKKQTTRMIKCECSECGYTVRTTAKWLESAGAPICPTDHISMSAPDFDLDDDESEGE